MKTLRVLLTRSLFLMLCCAAASSLHAATVTTRVTWTAQQIVDAYQMVYGNTEHSLYNESDGFGVGLVDLFVRPDSPVFSYSLAAAEVQTSFTGYVGTAEQTSPDASGETTGPFTRWARWADAVAAPVNLLTAYTGPLYSVYDGVSTPFGYVPMDATFSIIFKNVNVPYGTVGQFTWYVYGTTLQRGDDGNWYADPNGKDRLMSFTTAGTFETPEPGSASLLLLGCAGLFFAHRILRK